MTIDKIKTIIGESLFNHISSLDADNLNIMKSNLEADLKFHVLGSVKLYERNIELKYINQRLTTN